MKENPFRLNPVITARDIGPVNELFRKLWVPPAEPLHSSDTGERLPADARKGMEDLVGAAITDSQIRDKVETPIYIEEDPVIKPEHMGNPSPEKRLN
jgi:hypothetical protein